jgi:hypothetical protein
MRLVAVVSRTWSVSGALADLLPRFYGVQQEIADARRLAKILLETGEAPDGNGAKLLRRSADGHDPARLRGLPAIGRNVAGARHDTDPVKALLRREARGELPR